jgi:hypothetical protein
MARRKSGAAKRAGGTRGPLEVTVKPFGPSTEELAAIGARVMELAAVRAFFGRGKYRLLYVQTLEPSEESKRTRPVAPSQFRATLYDDTHARTVFAVGELENPSKVTLTESGVPPHPSREEFTAAVDILRADETLGGALLSGRVQPYRPIPALHLERRPDGSVERRIAVGLLPRAAEERHEIVSVQRASGHVLRFEERAPEGARAPNAGVCGVPHSANQETAGQGTAGQAWLTVKQGGETLWRLLVVRPAASSGVNGSGIELRYVDYKGKRVLYRAHVPILNVKYDGDACGPYRDWQYEEGMIEAQGKDVAPGFRLCSAPARTILDTGSDSGNFLGVGIYVQGSEVVLVSEMEAGWYRYVSEWRLGSNGAIHPRFGFAAVESPCVCNVHHHHAYWRFDFDIRSAGHNRVREFNDPPLAGTFKWHTQRFESQRPRDPGHKRKWRVENTESGEGYEVVPRAEDGVAAAQPDAPFGRGDVWILRYRSTEIDDGVIATGPPYEAQLDSWVNGEAVSDHDVVLWYGAHFTHDVAHSGPAPHGHVVGPDLKPVNW